MSSYENIRGILKVVSILTKCAKFILYIMLACILFVNVFGLQDVMLGVPKISLSDKEEYQFLLDSEVLKLTLILVVLEALDNIVTLMRGEA